MELEHEQIKGPKQLHTEEGSASPFDQVSGSWHKALPAARGLHTKSFDLLP